jgi:hypothetical protein
MNRSLFRASRSPKLELVRFHIHPPPAKAHALGLQAEALFQCGVAAKFDRAACSQHALPGQSESAPQHRRHLPRRPGRSRCACDCAISRNRPPWNASNRALDPQAYLGRSIRIVLSNRRSAPTRSHSPVLTEGNTRNKSAPTLLAFFARGRGL